MKPLSSYLNEKLIELLRHQIAKKRFPGISFENAMQFLLADGIIPESGLPPESFLMLEDWVRAKDPQTISYTTTDLKNKTGEVLQSVMEGKTVRLIKHGRPVAEIKKIAS